MLSVIITAKNEQTMITDCLKSVMFADEVILIDNDSTDKTAQIAKKFKAKVYQTQLSGWDNLHNLGLSRATKDWIFYIDADERVSESLKKTLKLLTKNSNGQYSAYRISRKNIYLGKEMKYGGWGSDSVIRLFQKSKLDTWVGNLHEQPKFIGELGTISDQLIHYSHRDLYSMTEKTINFTNHEANNRLALSHPPVVWWRFIRVMITEFYLRFIKLSAFKDGPEGIIDGLFQVYNSFIIYARLWELQHDQKSLHL